MNIIHDITTRNLAGDGPRNYKLSCKAEYQLALNRSDMDMHDLRIVDHAARIRRATTKI